MYYIFSPPNDIVASGLAVSKLEMYDCEGYGGNFETDNINNAFRYQQFLFDFYKERGYTFEVREKA